MDNKVEIVDSKRAGMKVEKGTSSIEFSSESIEQICTGVIELGIQLVAEVGKVTVEYFRTQVDMYYAELNAYIDIEHLSSKERMEMLRQLEKVTDCYSKKITDAYEKEKNEQAKELTKTYMIFAGVYKELYEKNIGHEEPRPTRPHLFQGLKKLFSKK